MRKILVPFALMGLSSLPLVACDVQGDDEDGTNTTENDTSVTPDGDTSVEPTKYFALVLDDSAYANDHCISTSGAEGADIDAVELIDGGNSLGFFKNVIYNPGSMCSVTGHNDVDDVKDAPDGDLTSGYLSLGYGSVAGEFGASQIQIKSGQTVKVYEIGDDACEAAGLTPGVNCVGDEEYDVSVVTSLACLDDGGCEEVQLTNGEGVQTIPLTGF